MSDEQPRRDETRDRPPEDPSADLTVGALAREAVGEIAGLEKRLPRTLLKLLTRPGFLTDEHRRGRGGQYVSPVRLYVAASALYFASGFAREPQGVNLGLFTVTEVFGRVPVSSVPHLILIAAVPLFALLLSGLFRGRPTSKLWLRLLRPGFRWGTGRKASLGEFMVFALYFQTVLLLFILLLDVLPLPSAARSLTKVTFFVGYLGLAARRLWRNPLLVGLVKGTWALFMYMFCIGMATGVAAWLEGLVRG